jgi:hypothetical protein
MTSEDQKLQRIIFLDIDGPIINTPCYYLDSEASMQRTVMNTQALGYVVRLAKIGNAKIVTNSSHNYADVGCRTLKDDLIKWGIKEEYFHKNWRTEYPNPKTGKFSASSANRRMIAIENWQDDNGEADWVAFDDENFTDNKRLILIDFDRGIDYSAYRKAAKVWHFRQDPLTLF